MEARWIILNDWSDTDVPVAGLQEHRYNVSEVIRLTLSRLMRKKYLFGEEKICSCFWAEIFEIWIRMRYSFGYIRIIGKKETV